jgi:hypothetical protein
MTRWKIEIARRVGDAAARQGVVPEQLAGEVVAERFPPGRKLGFVSVGRSTGGSTTQARSRVTRSGGDRWSRPTKVIQRCRTS